VGRGRIQLVEKAPHISGHLSHRVRARVVRLRAAAVASAVQADHAIPRAYERLLPSRTHPVELVIRREAVHQDYRRTGLRTVKLVMQAHAVAVELHPRRYATPFR